MTRWQFSHLLLLFISATICLGGRKSGNTSLVKDEEGWWTTGRGHGNDYGNDTNYINQDYWDDDDDNDYEDSFYDAPKGNKGAIAETGAF